MAWTQRYVTPTGAGTQDGTTEANAWDLDDAISGTGGGSGGPAAAGDQVNLVQGSGNTYTRGADTTFPSGSSENPIRWVGMTTSGSPDDLEDVGRATATAALTNTNFPKLDGTASYNFTAGAYNQFQNVWITSGENAQTLVGASNFNAYRCCIENTNTTGAAVMGVNMANTYTSLVDCDVFINSSSTGARVLNAGRSGIHGCRVWNDTTTASTQVGIQCNGIASINHCIVFNVGRAFLMGSIDVGPISHCSVYDVVTGVYLGGGGLAIANNVFDNVSGYLFDGATGGSPLLVNNASTTPTSGRINTGTLGTVIAEISAVDLGSRGTADNIPFTDPGSEDFTLDSNTGGTACRAASVLFGGFRDLGAVQHEDAGGGGGGCKLVGPGGGMIG